MEPWGASSISLLLCATCLFFLLAWRKASGNSRLPPGPSPLPFLGNLLQLDTKNFPSSVEKLSQKYGPVFTIHLGSKRAVVLYGHEVVKEALLTQGDEFGGRGSSPIIDKTANGTGIGFSHGETWKQLRQFAVTTLHDLGMRPTQSTEEKVQEEACFLEHRLRGTEGRVFDPTLFLSQASANILCSITMGSRFDYEDKDFLRFTHLLEKNSQLQSCTMAQLYNIFPTLLDYFPGPHQKIFENTEELKRFISKRVKMHEETLDPSQPRDFIDAFLIKMEQEEQKSQSVFNHQSLVRSILDIFVAGAESVGLVLKYGLLILLKHPEIEEKVHQEIDDVIGRSQRPCMADLDRMPYTAAVVHEILRFIALVPLNVPRAVTKDTHFKQYLIPKGTTIFPALKPSLYNSREFPNPQDFDPGHFLDGNGAFRKSDFFIPFSTGKRACVGERLACMSISVVLVAVLQHFALKPPGSSEQLDLSPTTGFLTVAPKPYQLSAVPR
ncbi:cytochrome P450 2H2-like [Eublepharis macularius]|uniref:unspecific monooxygenase n=1 Tax=Eublepharis macularius TaxID=481883 RepID=A0AA97KQZ4_EUBMA|nr:cytochrome P450 2H2-like [Eublepharis macularius]